MDKFGIFNLLNSFFPLNAQKEQLSSNNSAPSNDIFSNLFSSLIKPENQEKPSAKKSAPLSVPHPLQEQMLLTVSNHDAIVKRVKQQKKNL